MRKSEKQLLSKANLSTFLRLLALIFWVGAVGGGGVGAVGRALGVPELSGELSLGGSGAS